LGIHGIQVGIDDRRHGALLWLQNSRLVAPAN